MGGKLVRRKRKCHEGPIRRVKNWVTRKAKGWIGKNVRQHLGIGGGARGRGLRLFSAPGLVNRRFLNSARVKREAAARKRRTVAGSTSRGGSRYYRRRRR